MYDDVAQIIAYYVPFIISRVSLITRY